MTLPASSSGAPVDSGRSNPRDGARKDNILATVAIGVVAVAVCAAGFWWKRRGPTTTSAQLLTRKLATNQVEPDAESHGELSPRAVQRAGDRTGEAVEKKKRRKRRKSKKTQAQQQASEAETPKAASKNNNNSTGSVAQTKGTAKDETADVEPLTKDQAALQTLLEQHRVVNECSARLKQNPADVEALTLRARALALADRKLDAAADLCYIVNLTGLMIEHDQQRQQQRQEQQQQQNQNSNGATDASASPEAQVSPTITKALEGVQRDFEMLLQQVASEDAMRLFESKRLERPTLDALPATAFSLPFFYAFSGEADKFRVGSEQLQRQAAALTAELEARAHAEQLEEAEAAAAETAECDVLRFELAFVLKHQKKFRAAAELFEEICERYPEDAVFDAEGGTEGNSNCTKRLTKEQVGLCFEELSSIYHLCTNLVKAEDLIERAIHLLPGRVQTVIKAAEISVELEKNAKAQEFFDKARQIVEEQKRSPQGANPDDVADLHYHVASCQLVTTTNPKEVIPDLELALEARPEFGLATMHLGVACYQAQQVEKAIETLKRSVGLAPELFQTYSYLGEVYMDQNRTAEAKEMFEKACAADDTSAMPYVNLGALKVAEYELTQERSLFTDALRLYQKAMVVDPKCDLACVRCGLLFFQMGNLKLAMKNYDRAIALSRSKNDLIEFCMYRAHCLAQARASDMFATLNTRNATTATASAGE